MIYAGGLHTIQHLQVGDMVLPINSNDGVKSVYVKVLQLFEVLSVQSPGLTFI